MNIIMKASWALLFLPVMVSPVFADSLPAQANLTPTRIIVDGHSKWEKELKKLTPQDQWSYFELYSPEQNYVFIQNKNVRNYVLSFGFNCMEADVKAKFLIEDAGGLDRLSSDDQITVDIVLDGQHYGNPFAHDAATDMDKFKQALMQTKLIQFNAETYGAPFKFINQRPELLMAAVNCS
ncbi:hypothetical protein [Acinetobacter sp. WCHAc010052]|uniref:hypothetical protein n=1 Tax=Acinetobacter sp. WCHAc010052 TaxID=2004647 RepID=UPI0011C3E53F|nr:hypothetical protein [Acinetobacter sp. WCHAc010052]